MFVRPYRAEAEQLALEPMPLNTVSLGITSEWLTTLMEIQERLLSFLLPDSPLNAIVAFWATL